MTETRRRYAQNNHAMHSEDEESLLSGDFDRGHRQRKSTRHADDSEQVPVLAIAAIFITVVASLFGVVFWIFFTDASGGLPMPPSLPCDTVSNGYQCSPALSHTWGQHSPYYRVESEIAPTPPVGCEVTFVQLLYRHGARFPTTDKTVKYNDTIAKIQRTGSNFTGQYEFLESYDYGLGANDLTGLGKQELVNAGVDSFLSYEPLVHSSAAFIRAADQERVVESARKWSEGFHKAKIRSGTDKDSNYPYPILEMSEDDSQNNTLSHGLCTAFEANKSGQAAMTAFGQTFLPDITSRIKRDLQVRDFDDADTLSVMELCPFTVVAGTNFSSLPEATTSDPSQNPFCALFTAAEWEKYDYLQSVGKYYGYGPGAPLGPTQGVGFANELIARLSASPVRDTTSVNHTLDSAPGTFPLDRQLYADFSHDNNLIAIFSALGLFEAVPELSKQKIMNPEDMMGYTASKTVPFAGRMAVEKLMCKKQKEDMVRVILNGRVWPLEGCDANEKGMCTVSSFVESLEFARKGGKWDDCFQASIAVPAIDTFE